MEQVAMSEPSYETTLLVATQRNKLAVAQIKSNDSLTPTARRQAFAQADAHARLRRLFPPRRQLR